MLSGIVAWSSIPEMSNSLSWQHLLIVLLHLIFLYIKMQKVTMIQLLTCEPQPPTKPCARSAWDASSCEPQDLQDRACGSTSAWHMDVPAPTRRLATPSSSPCRRTATPCSACPRWRWRASRRRRTTPGPPWTAAHPSKRLTRDMQGPIMYQSAIKAYIIYVPYIRLSCQWLF